MKTPLPDSLQALFAVVIFVMPGFVAMGALRLALPRRQQSEGARVLQAITFSSINYVLWFYPLWIVYKSETWKENPLQAYALAVVVLLVSPTILGLLTAVAIGMRWIGFLIHCVTRLPQNQPADTAWDYFHQSRCRSAFWVVVTLKGGGLVCGYYGSRSFAGSNLDGGERDLFIEAVSDRDWNVAADSEGAYIKECDILLIEFIKIPLPQKETLNVGSTETRRLLPAQARKTPTLRRRSGSGGKARRLSTTARNSNRASRPNP